METVTGTGQWYKAGAGLVPILWVFVRDCEGTHRDEYFYTTDATLRARRVIAYYTGRWNLETTFQEVRCCLHLETARGWCRTTVLRGTPCLFGLYSVVVSLYNELPTARRILAISWPGKTAVTFSDALAVVRRWIWSEGAFSRVHGGSTVEKLPAPLREVLYLALSPAA